MSIEDCFFGELASVIVKMGGGLGPLEAGLLHVKLVEVVARLIKIPFWRNIYAPQVRFPIVFSGRPFSREKE